jgi:pyruvate formate lyase activating enzyme
MQKEAMLYEPLSKGKVHCYLCNHHCRIPDSKYGKCGVRQNQGGTLYTHAYGEVIAAHVDPIEKKPLYHFFPGSTSFSVATPGCNFSCGFCQNWQISQISEERRGRRFGTELSPEKIVEEARNRACRSISYTYTEPTIFFEYAYETAKHAKASGVSNVFVTNGFMTTQALDTIQPYLDACNVDLKSFSEEFYKKTCGGRLEPVLETIRHMKQLNFWVEITTLVVPGKNDDESQLAGIAGFIVEIDPEIPWHISRFHPDFEFNDSPATPVETLEKAYSIGKKAGLKYIYLGNVPGKAGDTRCPRCQDRMFRRRGFSTQTENFANGRCASCGTRIAGVF